MSEENKAPEVAPKPAAPAAAAKPEAPPPEPGEYGRQLERAGVPVQHLGKDANGVEMLRLEPGDLLRGAEILRDDARFDLLVSCAGVDWKTHRESVYHLYSTDTHASLALKINAQDVNGEDHSPSLMPVYPAADWHERESYDLLGIHYDGHPSLQRILMPADWIGYPLRKDYKVTDPRLVWNER